MYVFIYQHHGSHVGLYDHNESTITRPARGTAWHSPAEEFEGHEVVVFFEAAAGAHGQASLRTRNRF